MTKPRDGFTQGPLWEVFAQDKSGEPHYHVGSVHAADGELALQNARDTFARRSKLVSLWVVESEQIVASNPLDAASFFDPGDAKIYRHPRFYRSTTAKKRS